MGLCLLCARRVAILSGLAVGFGVAVAGAGVCADGIYLVGSSCVGAIQGVAGFIGV